MKRIFILLFSFIVFNSCIYGQSANRDLATNDILKDDEIRTVLCNIENHKYSNAQITLEKILQKEPQNIYAQKLLPGVLANYVNSNDKSPANNKKIKIAIEAYEKLLNNPDVSKEDKLAINGSILSLIGTMDDEQKTAELHRRAENQTLDHQIRSKYYVALAAQSNGCANQITESVKKISRQSGKEIYIFNKPAKPEVFAKLKQCTAKGVEFIDKAINLDAKSEMAWSYKASLFGQKMRIAEMEGNKEEKEVLKKEYDSAVEKFLALDKEKRKIEDKFPQDYAEKQPNISEFAKELTVYKVKRPLSELIKEVYIPIDNFWVAPVPVPEDFPPGPEDNSTSSSSTSKKTVQKTNHIWKIFSAKDDEFTAELPENAKVDSITSDKSVIYTASSEGIKFLIISQPKNAGQNSSLDDAVLNTLAWSVVIPTGNLSMSNNSVGNFEANLVSREHFGGQPARYYDYTVTSCSGKTDGVVILLIGKTRNFAIHIDGANEKAPQIQRFLKSWKIVGK